MIITGAPVEKIDFEQVDRRDVGRRMAGRLQQGHVDLNGRIGQQAGDLGLGGCLLYTSGEPHQKELFAPEGLSGIVHGHLSQLCAEARRIRITLFQCSVL